MQSASQTIYFDYESNSFYRVNKQTGQFTKSYKNGNDLKTFKPNITGFNYKSRKLCIQNNQDSKNKRMSPNLLQKRQNDFQRRTIQNFNNKSNPKEKEKIKNKSLNFHFENQIQTHNNPQKLDTSSKKGKLPNLKQSILGLNSQNLNNEISNSQNLNSQEETTKTAKQLFSLTLRRFSEVNKYKERQNNSLRKHIKANQQKVQSQLQKCIINLKNYKTLDPLSDGYKTQKKEKLTLKRQLNLPPFYSVKQQKNRQNSLFFRIHPQTNKQQTQDMKKRQEQRKKNMKQLQQLFIKQNQIKTSQVYSNSQTN